MLLVDDEPAIVQSLRRALFRHREAWEVEFVTSGARALSALSERPFDALITDIRMPELDGPGLLTEAVARWPSLVRVVLTGDPGEARPARVEALERLAHHVLIKPVSVEALFHRVEQSLRARDRLVDPALRALVVGLGPLPALPATFEAVTRVTRRPDFTLAELVEVVEADRAVCSHVLRVVNSAWFGLGKPVSSMREAVRLLGVRPLESVVLATEVFSGPGAAIEGLRQRALRRLATVPQLARSLGVEALRDEAATALVLADVGEFLLWVKAPTSAARIERVMAGGRARLEAERAELGGDHAVLGAVVLELWGLPPRLVEAVALHHARADELGSPSLAAFVALACRLHDCSSAEGPVAAPLLDEARALARLFAVDDLAPLLATPTVEA